MTQDFIANPEWNQNLMQLTAIVGGMAEGVVAFDTTGKLYFANSTALDLYGLSHKEFHQNIHNLDALFVLHDIEGEVLTAEAYPTARLLRGESFGNYRVWVQRKGEERRWLAAYNGAQVAVSTSDGSVPLCIKSVRDVTAQHELEARHRATFELNPTAMSICRLEDLLFTDVNESFTRLTGYTCDEVVGKTADQLRLQIEREKRAIAIKRLRGKNEGGIIEHEAPLRTKSGSYRTVVSEGRVIRFDGVPHLIDTYLDISDRKQAENELTQAVQAAMQDSSWFVRVVQEKLTEIRSGRAPKPGLELLSPRELELLEVLAQGLSNDQIAQRMGLATQTVRNYISKVYDKLGVHSRGEAIIWARERGLIFPT